MLTTDTVILKEPIKRRQTVLDYTCQFGGTMEALFDVAQLNGLSITQDMISGTLLLAPQEELKVIDYYKRIPEIDIVTDVDVTAKPGGIDYMGIEIDFIVS